MQPAALLAVSVLASTAVSYAIVTLAAPKPAEATTPVDAELAQKVATLQGKLEEQQQTIARLSRQAAPAEAPARSSVPTVSEAQVEAAVLGWLEKHAADAAPG